MKRILASMLALVSVGMAVAQAPFTIARPADGSKIRETVKIRVPKGSIPPTGFVGVYLQQKPGPKHFVEATVLDAVGDYYEYPLDTKRVKLGQNRLVDGPLTIELVLYVSQGERPVVADRTSVDVNVTNSSSISIPANGMALRYKFRRGEELIFDAQERTSVATISEAQAKMGGRAAELPIESDNYRMLYAVDNTYSNGDGLIRSQALLPKGKQSLFVKTSQEPEGRHFQAWELASLYMRLSSTGVERFGSMPMYVPIEGSVPDKQWTDLFVFMPLPSLPDKRVKPGDSWQSRLMMLRLDFDNIYKTTTLGVPIPARGEFVGVEWEMGHPCAKLKYSIAQAFVASNKEKLSKDGLGGDRISLEQTVWFALDRGIPIKIAEDTTQDFKQVVEGAPSNQGGNRGNNPNGGPNAPGQGAPPGVGSGIGANRPPTPAMQGDEGGRGGRGGRGAGGGAQGGQDGGRFGNQGRQGNQGAGAGARTQYFRMRSQRLYVLEK